MIACSNHTLPRVTVLESTCSEVLPGFHDSTDCDVSQSEPSTDGHTQQNPMFAATVDIQVLELQEKLTFAKGVAPFQLTNSVRHLIFSGDLVFLRDDLCVTLTVTLLSDLLLLMVRESGGRLRVVEDPVVLADIQGSDFSRSHRKYLLID